jgi:phage tail-like protein
MSDLPEDPNPFGNYYFALEIKDDGGTVEVAHFVECSGLKSSSTVFEIEEGGLNGRTHKRPGQSKWENLVLRYATNTSTYMLEWRDKFLQDQFDQRTKCSGSVALKNNHGDVVRRWHFTNAWPVSWEGPSLSSTSSELAIESLEIAHDGLTISNQ